MLLKYVPVLIWILLSVAASLVVLVLSRFLGRKGPASSTIPPYECGMASRDAARKLVPVRFYLIAAVFVIFDMGAAFLFPWAAVCRDLRFAGLAGMGIFIVILLVGYVYLRKRGVFDWED